MGNFTSEVISSNAGAGLGGGGREAVIATGSAASHEEKRQNKPNAVTRTVVKEVEMAPCVERPDGRVRRKDAPGLTSSAPLGLSPQAIRPSAGTPISGRRRRAASSGSSRLGEMTHDP